MSVTYGDLLCEDPWALAASCTQAVPPLPLAPWFGIAHRYACPVGVSRPGFAHILLNGGQLAELSGDANDLVFGDENGEKTFTNMRLVGTPICVTPGYRGDPTATFMVELADRRIDAIGLANKRYNWKMFPDCTYDSFSLNSGSPWTWEQMLADLWATAGTLGVFPGLPLSPSTNPEQIDASACRAVDIIDDLLLLLGMGAVYDPVNDLFEIISFSLVNTNWQAAVAIYDDKRLWDQEPKTDAGAPIPQYVRVQFPVWSPAGAPISHDSYFAIDVEIAATVAFPDINPNSNLVQPGTYCVIQDYHACLTNNLGVCINLSDLQSRATDVSEVWFSKFFTDQFTPFSRTYSGIIDDDAIMPGPAFDVVAWEDVGEGTMTRVVRTGRLGEAGLIKQAGYIPDTTGAIRWTHPNGEYFREPAGSTDQDDPIQRAGGLPPGELRLLNTGPLSSPIHNSAIELAGGQPSAMMKHIPPLRHWDSVVRALAVDGNGQRLWKPKPRMQYHCWVKVTNITPSGDRYDAIEQFYDPVAETNTNGEVCYFVDANGQPPILNDRYFCRLEGVFNSKKVYRSTMIDVNVANNNCVTMHGVLTTDAPNANPATDKPIKLLGQDQNGCWKWFPVAKCGDPPPVGLMMARAPMLAKAPPRAESARGLPTVLHLTGAKVGTTRLTSEDGLSWQGVDALGRQVVVDRVETQFVLTTYADDRVVSASAVLSPPLIAFSSTAYGEVVVTI